VNILDNNWQVRNNWNDVDVDVDVDDVGVDSKKAT
jgi:hypothetical protein